MTELTQQDKQVLRTIIMNGRYTPEEWENVVKPIMLKLQEAQPNGNPV